jgi:hypothetical protein
MSRRNEAGDWKRTGEPRYSVELLSTGRCRVVSGGSMTFTEAQALAEQKNRERDERDVRASEPWPGAAEGSFDA